MEDFHQQYPKKNSWKDYTPITADHLKKSLEYLRVSITYRNHQLP